ncbi:MAG: hypothetical protein ABI665_09535 [Vicinamibacterales bacterium]
MGAVVDRFMVMLGSLSDPPVPLASAWVAWFAFGLVLAFWYYRARVSALEMRAITASTSRPRSKSGDRPPVKSQPKPDAFGDLQTLLDSGSEPSNSRRPGE